MDPSPRGKESTALEQAVSRAVRDNLALVQHTTKELSQAIEDFVAACGSTRTANMLPAMLRAQTASASLAAMLEVLSRLLTTSLQPGRVSAPEAYVASLAPAEAPAAEPAGPPYAPAVPTAPPHAVPQGYAAPEAVVAAAVAPPPVAPVPEPEPAPVMAAAPEVLEAPPPPVEAPPAPAAEAEPVVVSHGLVSAPETEPAPPQEFVPAGVDGGPLVPPETMVAVPPAQEAAVAVAEPAPVFRVEDLPPEQQELHRRANRHAKVSMQDIYLLRPKDVQLARQNKDICVRLRGDIEKARKEYVRRFGPILEHPVDYFYHWMVEVLAEGKPESLGEYPYPSAATRR
jgi:hypothetical protein